MLKHILVLMDDKRWLIMAATEQTKESCITGMENLPIDVETYLQKLLTGARSDLPPAAEASRQGILEADSTLVASPEHNYSVFDTVSFHEALSIYE